MLTQNPFDKRKTACYMIALDDYYRVNAEKGESHYDFCVRNGWQEYIDRMIAVDYIILNREYTAIAANGSTRIERRLLQYRLTVLYKNSKKAAAAITAAYNTITLLFISLVVIKPIPPSNVISKHDMLES